MLKNGKFFWQVLPKTFVFFFVLNGLINGLGKFFTLNNKFIYYFLFIAFYICDICDTANKTILKQIKKEIIFFLSKCL